MPRSNTESIKRKVLIGKESKQMRTNGYKQAENEKEEFPANTGTKKPAHLNPWGSCFGPVVESVPIHSRSKPAQLIRAPAAADP